MLKPRWKTKQLKANKNKPRLPPMGETRCSESAACGCKNFVTLPPGRKYMKCDECRAIAKNSIGSSSCGHSPTPAGQEERVRKMIERAALGLPLKEAS